MSKDDKEKAIEQGVPLETVNVTEFELAPDQAALIVYKDGVTMVFGENDEDEYIPQHILFVIGVYFRSADPAFVELMVRSALDAIANTEMDD